MRDLVTLTFDLFTLNSYHTWRVTWTTLPSLKTLRVFFHELRVLTFPVYYHWKCVPRPFCFMQIIRWKLKIRLGNRAHCIQHAWIVKKSRSPLLPQNAPNMHILRNASSLSNPPHGYENSHAIRDHTVLPATRQSWHFHLYPNHFTFRLDLPLKLFAKTEANLSFGLKPNFRSWLSFGLKL